MKFIDLFSGIGGFRSALEKHGHECLAYSEIDKFAKQSYQAIYDTENEVDLGDITKVTEEDFGRFKNECDIIVGGFPCQAFSIAGKRRGFEDTRGTLFFHIARAIKEIEPSYVLLENVKGLLSHDKGRTFGTIIQALDELGYVVEWQLFNSKFWGVPQNRERVYILVTRQDIFNGSKLFDLGKMQTNVKTRLIDVLDSDVDEKFYLSEEKTKKLILNHNTNDNTQHNVIVNQLGNIVSNKNTFGGNPQRGRIYDSDELSPTLNCMRGGGLEPKVAILGNTSNTGHRADNVHDINGIVPTIAARDYKGAKQIAVPVLTPDRVNKRQNGRRFKDDGEEMFTLTAQDKHGVLVREATKQGYTIAKQGDSVNVAYPKSKTRRGRVGKQVAQTLQAGDVNQGVVTKDIRIRKLTPLECWRLQGFTDEQFQKAKDSGMSNSQLYKQAGNAVTVNVVDAIVSKLKEER
ncbi:TPA: DNA (cytosine-5-)-methyltransferase [Staphylococcus pseudintermedius]|nr:DNA (cytosine-5-)-methyltransferase [Staphylococcus pseudintermedius]EIQ3846399.1 DNA (cytosine-5-)-methyltransferase [Staphylococcus pseudintermedius]MDK3642493.1 DNA (cytosine-5-)-methyltransferase [Staphylococcus pseudintermedius]MDK3682532.1 DNA (cytosine-5-)-methyltransferase [Staphylococcus pseudintermedius]HAR6468506.1 DNA (cytosine-5-)-methyltransferase [Staphylococcus pseudintermedius]